MKCLAAMARVELCLLLCALAVSGVAAAPLVSAHDVPMLACLVDAAWLRVALLLLNFDRWPRLAHRSAGQHVAVMALLR